MYDYKADDRHDLQQNISDMDCCRLFCRLTYFLLAIFAPVIKSHSLPREDQLTHNCSNANEYDEDELNRLLHLFKEDNTANYPLKSFEELGLEEGDSECPDEYYLDRSTQTGMAEGQQHTVAKRFINFNIMEILQIYSLLRMKVC